MPTLDINADKWETIKFITDNKLSIRITEGGKRRGVKSLKEDLEKGGYIVGVKGKSRAPKQRGVASDVKAEKARTVEQQYAKLREKFPTGFGSVSNINPIKLRGFVNTTESSFLTPATTEEVHMSGYGGLPYFVNRLGSVDLSVQEIVDYLSSRVPTEDFRRLRPYELKQFYIKVRQQVEAEPDDDDDDDDNDDDDRIFGDDKDDEVIVGGKLYERFTWDGEKYWGQGEEDIYDMPGGKKIGFWDPEDKIVILEEEISSEEEVEEEEEAEEEQVGKSLKDWSFQGIKYYLDENYTDERTPTGGTMKVKQIYRNKYDTKPLGYLDENSKYAPPGENVSIVWGTLDLKFEHDAKVRKLKK